MKEPNTQTKHRKDWRKAYDSKRRKTAKYRAWRREYDKKRRATLIPVSTPQTRANKARLNRKYRKDPRFRLHHIARKILNRAISSGWLVKFNCEVCGSIKSEAHHDDYSRPLDVRWLCKKHHAEHHAKMRSKA